MKNGCSFRPLACANCAGSIFCTIAPGLHRLRRAQLHDVADAGLDDAVDRSPCRPASRTAAGWRRRRRCAAASRAPPARGCRSRRFSTASAGKSRRGHPAAGCSGTAASRRRTGRSPARGGIRAAPAADRRGAEHQRRLRRRARPACAARRSSARRGAPASCPATTPSATSSTVATKGIGRNRKLIRITMDPSPNLLPPHHENSRRHRLHPDPRQPRLGPVLPHARQGQEQPHGAARWRCGSACRSPCSCCCWAPTRWAGSRRPACADRAGPSQQKSRTRDDPACGFFHAGGARAAAHYSQ